MSIIMNFQINPYKNEQLKCFLDGQEALTALKFFE